jgi:hypothetical protein
MKDILPSMPKGEIVGNMSTAEMTHMVKVVIDGYNRRMTQMIKVFIDGNRCWKQTQMLQHKCENRSCNTKVKRKY